MNNWIKCSDKMPPKQRAVLVYNDNVGYTVAWKVWDDYLKDNVGELDINCSYWQELPKGPYDE